MTYQVPAISRNPRRIQIARTDSLPAPVGGWNDRDSLAAMDKKDAVVLDNFWPMPSKVIVRKGCEEWATGIGAQVETLMAYQPSTGTSKLFAAAGTSIYDATSQGAVAAAVVGSLSNARWQYTNIATSGGNFLMAVNGADKLRGYTGSAWWVDGDGTHDITVADTSKWSYITQFKRRVWGVEKSSTKAWYLPTDSIAGAAAYIDLGPIFMHGGYLVAIANWTKDGGAGADDFSAFIGSNGDIAIYQGTDPASAATWALVGNYYMGAPVGRRCVVQYMGDVLIICQDGLFPLSKSLQSQDTNTAISLTDKIQNTMSTAVTLYGDNFGWQVTPFPGVNMLVVNVPVAVGNQQQYVMNTITGAWCRFKGWAANCFEIYANDLFYGGSGSTFKAWQNNSDNGDNITAEALQSFQYFGNRTSLKEFTLARPLVAVSSSSGFTYGLNTDFDMTAPSGVPGFSSSAAATWGVSKWGVGTWGGSPTIQKRWQSVSGTGYCAAMHIVSATNNGSVEWYATDYAFKQGGIV